MSPLQIAVVVLSAVAAIAVIAFLFRKDDAIEERRGNMLSLYAKLSELGLTKLATIAKAYTIGDYSGLYREAHTLLHEINNPESAMLLLSKSFFIQLPHRLKDTGDFMKIQEILGQSGYTLGFAAEAVTPTSTPLTTSATPIKV